MRFIFSCLIAIAFCTSCNLIDRLPEGYPDKEEFALVLTDIHISEATLSQLRIKNREVDKQSAGYYHDVLAKYDLTESKFDSVVSWYLSRPEVYQEVYESVLSNLGQKEAQWQRVVKDQEEIKERRRKAKEARNIWPHTRKYIITNSDTLDRRIPFSIDVDTIDAKSYRLSAFYQFLKGSIANDPKFEVIAMYKDSSLDTLLYDLPSTFNNTKAEISVGHNKKDTIINLSGFLLNHDTTEIIRARIKQIEFELIPRNDTIFNDEEDSSTLLSATK